MFWARTYREVIVTKHRLVPFERGLDVNASAGRFNGLLPTCLLRIWMFDINSINCSGLLLQNGYLAAEVRATGKLQSIG